MHKAIQIATKCNRDKWIEENELHDILNNSNDPILTEQDISKRASKIYEQLEKKQASKSITAQWFAKLLNDDKDKVKCLINKDTQQMIGISYIINAIKHVTE